MARGIFIRSASQTFKPNSTGKSIQALYKLKPQEIAINAGRMSVFPRDLVSFPLLDSPRPQHICFYHLNSFIEPIQLMILMRPLNSLIALILEQFVIYSRLDKEDWQSNNPEPIATHYKREVPAVSKVAWWPSLRSRR